MKFLVFLVSLALLPVATSRGDGDFEYRPPPQTCLQGDTLYNAIVWTPLYQDTGPNSRFYCDSVQVLLDVQLGGFLKAALYTSDGSLALSPVVPAWLVGPRWYSFIFPNPDSGLNLRCLVYFALRSDSKILVPPLGGRGVYFKGPFPYTNDWPMGLPAASHQHYGRGFQLRAFSHRTCP